MLSVSDWSNIMIGRGGLLLDVEKHHNRVNTRQPSELIFLVENFRHFVNLFLEKGMQVPCCSGKKNRQKK